MSAGATCHESLTRSFVDDAKAHPKWNPSPGLSTAPGLMQHEPLIDGLKEQVALFLSVVATRHTKTTRCARRACAVQPIRMPAWQLSVRKAIR